MPLYTSNYLKGLSGSRTLNESTRIFSQRNNIDTSFDIFLCHSYLDKEEVKGLYLELTEMGFTVYVDWIVDPHLDRNKVTKETAEHVRNRLRSSKTLLLALSANATFSKWVPWELGYIDGKTTQCALLPVSQDNIRRTSFTRTEYLTLYPFVEKPNDLGRFQDKLWTIDGAHSYVDFQSWVNGRKPIQESINFFQ
jgi:hypothetical protein